MCDRLQGLHTSFSLSMLLNRPINVDDYMDYIHYIHHITYFLRVNITLYVLYASNYNTNKINSDIKRLDPQSL